RTRTSNQTVMSAVTPSEVPIKSDFSRRSNQQMFGFGSRHSLVIRWLGTKVAKRRPCSHGMLIEGTSAVDRGVAKAYLTLNTIDGKRDVLCVNCTMLALPLQPREAPRTAWAPRCGTENP